MVNMQAIIRTLQATAWLLTEFPEIIELDLNPVMVGEEGAVVADGRAVLSEITKLDFIQLKLRQPAYELDNALLCRNFFDIVLKRRHTKNSRRPERLAYSLVSPVKQMDKV
jgi:ATP-grasp domain